MKRFFTILLVFGLGIVKAQTGDVSGDGGFSGAYMEVGTARSYGMGQAFTAVSDKPEAVFYNPAGLGRVNEPNLILMGAQTYTSTSSIVSFDMPWAIFGTMNLAYAGSYSYINPSDSTMPSKVYANQSAVWFSYGKKIKFISFGFNGKFFLNSLYNYQATGFDLDAGVMLYPMSFIRNLPFDLLTVGLSVKNILKAKYKLISEEEQLSQIVNLGIGASLWDNKFNIGIDSRGVISDSGVVLSPRVGFEIIPISLFAFRVGGNKDVASAGLGYEFNITHGIGLAVDYALLFNYSAQEVAAPVHKLSLNFELRPFGGFWLEPDKKVLTSSHDRLKIDLHGNVQFKGRISAWEFLIKDRGGNVVYRIKRNVLDVKDELPGSLSWDQRNNVTGNPVDNGVYFYEIRVFDKLGDELRYKGRLVTINWGK